MKSWMHYLAAYILGPAFVLGFVLRLFYPYLEQAVALHDPNGWEPIVVVAGIISIVSSLVQIAPSTKQRRDRVQLGIFIALLVIVVATGASGMRGTSAIFAVFVIYWMVPVALAPLWERWGMPACSEMHS